MVWATRRPLGIRGGGGSDYVARRLIGRGAGYVCQQPVPGRREEQPAGDHMATRVPCPQTD